MNLVPTGLYCPSGTIRQAIIMLIGMLFVSFLILFALNKITLQLKIKTILTNINIKKKIK